MSRRPKFAAAHQETRTEVTKNHPAAKVLQAFFSEMTAWETDVAQYYKSVDWGNASQEILDRAKEQYRERLEAIFQKYCQAGAQAERLQDAGISYDPSQPEHGDESIISLTEKGRKVIIETRQMRPHGWEYRYELVQMDGRWLLRDTRKYRFQGDTDWERDML